MAFARYAFMVFSIVAALSSHPIFAEETKLRVSLFSSVPNPDGIKLVVEAAWKRVHPDIGLEFVEWDGYSEDPPAELDVFEFDSIMLDYLVKNSFLSPLSPAEIVDARGLYDFAYRGAMVDGVPYAVPRMTCTQLLFYRKGDSEIESASSIDEVFKIIGTSPDCSEVPEDNKGLLIDLTGGTTCSCLYLEAVVDADAEFSFAPTLPKGTELEETALSNLRLLTKMAGVKQATCKKCDRPTLFSQGKARILVGYSERLALMPESTHDRIKVKSLPLAKQNSYNVFAVDMLGINSFVEGRKRALAMEFINIATSTGVVVDTLRVRQPNTNSPQYLLPARRAVLDSPVLLKEAPHYADLKPVLETNARTFRVGPEVRHWLKNTKGAIRAAITQP